MDEPLARAGAQDHDVRHGCIDLRKVLGSQLLEIGDRPGGWRHFRQYQQAVVKAPGIDFDPAIVVGGDCLILLGGGGMQLHGVDRRTQLICLRELRGKDGEEAAL